MNLSKFDKRKAVFTLLKCIVSAILLLKILLNTNLDEITSVIHSINPFLLLIAFLLYLFGYYLRAWRWWVLLNAQDISTSKTYLLKSYMVGIFFNNFLPSMVGGDLSRAHDIWRQGTSKSSAVATVFVDRLLGFTVLVFFAVSALLLLQGLALNTSLLYFILLILIVTIFFVSQPVFMPSRSVLKSISLLIPSSWKYLSNITNKFIDSLHIFGRKKDSLIKAFALSFIIQTVVILHYYIIAQALNLAVPFHDFFFIIPLSSLVTMLPISINAIGIRENVFAFFFASYGVLKSESIVFAWLVYATVVIQGVLGGIVYVLRK